MDNKNSNSNSDMNDGKPEHESNVVIESTQEIFETHLGEYHVASDRHTLLAFEIS